jgi:hypothetical protein
MNEISENNYNEVKKYDILNSKLKLGSYIKAIPCDQNKNQPTLYGFLTKVNIENNLYSKTTLTLKYMQNGITKFIKIYPIKYDIYFKTIEDKKRKLFMSFLEQLETTN